MSESKYLMIGQKQSILYFYKMAKKGSAKAGYVYIFGYTENPDIVKIGETLDPEKRAKELSHQTGVIGEYYVVWQHKIEDDNKAVEKALHYKFREFSYKKEFFRIEKKQAITVAAKFMENIKPIKNPKANQLQTLQNNPSKDASDNASKALWNDILKSDLPEFGKKAIKLCLKEEKLGQPQYRRFSAIRSDRFTTIGRVDLYILKEHLRCVVTTKNIPQAKRIIKRNIGNTVKITTWEGGLCFFIKNSSEFLHLQQWFLLGNKKAAKEIEIQNALNPVYHLRDKTKNIIAKKRIQELEKEGGDLLNLFSEK